MRPPRSIAIHWTAQAAPSPSNRIDRMERSHPLHCWRWRAPDRSIDPKRQGSVPIAESKVGECARRWTVEKRPSSSGRRMMTGPSSQSSRRRRAEAPILLQLCSTINAQPIHSSICHEGGPLSSQIHRWILDLSVGGPFDPSPTKCRAAGKIGGRQMRTTRAAKQQRTYPAHPPSHSLDRSTDRIGPRTAAVAFDPSRQTMH